MSYFKAKMHPVRFRMGLCPRPRWESSQLSPRPLLDLRGPTSKERGGIRREKGGRRGGEEKRRGREGGGVCIMTFGGEGSACPEISPHGHFQKSAPMIVMFVLQKEVEL